MQKVYSSKPQQEYVVKGALATCMFGVAPSRLSNVLDNMFVNFNGSLVATSMTIGPCFQTPFFGMCNMVPSMPKPCTCMVTKWDLADNSVTINRIGHPLTKNSRGTCALGTPMCISFVLTGQFPIPGVPSIAAPSAVFQSDMSPLAQNEKPEDPPMLLSIEARSPEGKLVTEVPEDGYVTLVGLTKGHKEGDEVTFSLKDGRTYNGYVEADNKAYARNCYLGEPKDDQDNGNGSNDSDTKEEESKGNNASSSESESNEKALAANSDSEKETKKEEFRKNGVSEALINDDAALENLKLEKFRRDSWEKQANWLDSAIDEDFDPYDKKTFLELYKKSNK